MKPSDSRIPRALAVGVCQRKLSCVIDNKGMWMVRAYSINLREFFASISFEQLSSSQKIGFVNGFFDSEGSIIAGKRKNGVMRREILCYNTNKLLVDEISNFLLTLGIKTTVRISCKKGYSVIFRGIRSVANKDCYVISVCDAESQRLFCKHFTLFGRKQKKLNLIRRCIG